MKIQTINNDEEKAILVESHDVHLKNAELALPHKEHNIYINNINILC